MQKLVILSFALFFSFFALGCKEENTTLANVNPSGNVQTENYQSEQKSQNKEAKSKVAKAPTRGRYVPFSTETNFLLLTIENEDTQEKKEIVIDNNTWIRHAKELNIPTKPHTAYMEYMLEHEKTPFVISPELFAEFSPLCPGEPDEKMAAMSLEQLLNTYFNEVPREYIAKDRMFRTNKTLIKQLLRHDCIVTVGCESGMLTVRY